MCKQSTKAEQHACSGHLNWNNVRWQNVLFSDESRFCIDHADGRVRVWRRRGDRYADNCVVENNAWGGPSLMLGAIGHNQVLGPVIFQGLGPGRGNGNHSAAAWANIPRAASKTLVRSMTRRCQAVIDANGGHTRY
nr:hypothetical protein BaRGS_006596 [Batillaria attramentaria]